MAVHTPMRIVISGTAAGALGAGMHAAVLALIESGFLEAATWQGMLGRLGIGAVGGIVLAAALRAIPGGFRGHAAAGSVGAWIVAAIGGSLGAATLVAGLAWGVVAAFVAGQSLGLALPNANMGRRAEEFSDDPAGAHG